MVSPMLSVHTKDLSMPAQSFNRLLKVPVFTHVTSSPLYSQSNREAGHAFKTVNQIIKKTRDFYITLLAYRATPLANGYSLAQLLVGRNIRTTLPVTPSHLTPKLPDKDKVNAPEKKLRQSSKVTYDIRHRAKHLNEIFPGTDVFVRGKKTHGVVDKKLSEPRSYLVLSPTGFYVEIGNFGSM
ncbi:hypothetical protein HOLleu_29681 [Holothuria leucospilota]|uniref:Uncharacterized protein n=1 Tax=Holothuria leucospilota TaxID=206669 RepID=A0A9Q1GXS1_HOLLE|nr:hypothetical protein HOLleu_29681 [Holothuria leucospilota]